MPAHSEQQISPYTTRQLFDLVADIECYPEFLPWCRAARILERKEGENELMAELVISFSHMTESYVSRVLLTPPATEAEAGAIDVTMIKGPFEHLVNRWRFTPRAGGGADIDFFLDFKFRSRMLEKLIGSLFGKATAKMVGAFRTRADALYSKAKA
jgi:coenzyme Q-binding protein COQ10